MRGHVALFMMMTLAAPAAAQVTDTVRLPDLVVTATRLETRVDAVPGSVTVIRGTDMRARGHRFVVDALRDAPGVSIAQSAGPGAQTSVFIRGGESDYVQVLVDGVQVNGPGGAFNWAHLRTEDIDRIEIVRGPASVLYGSDAVSGVIQIFTRAGGQPRIEAGVNSARGSRTIGDGAFDTHSFDASLTGRASVATGTALSYGVSGAYATSSGLYEQNSDYDNTNVSGRIRLDARRADVAVTTRYAENEYHYPTSGSGAVIDANQFATGSTWSLGVDAGASILDGVELRLLGTLYDTGSRTQNPPDAPDDGTFDSTSDQLRRALDARVNITLPRDMVLTAGAEREWQEAQTAFESVGPGGTFTDETDDERANTGWYAQLHGSPIREVSITLGGRVDDNDAFGTFVTGRAAVSWRPVPSTRVHGSYGTAFKEPTFFENFATGFARGNPDLEPEHARSWEAGAELALGGSAVLGATYFEQRFRNLIQFTFNTPTPDDPNYFNVGAARAHGAELTAAVGFGPVSASASYTLTRTRVSDDGFGEDPAFQEGRPLLRRPEHQASIAGSVALAESLSGRIQARWVGEREDLDFTDPAQFNGIRTTLEDYTVVDVTFDVRMPHAIELTVGVRNLFDADYQEIFNFPTPGRVLHAGIRARLGL